jgi:hypothetical protein
MGQDDTSVVATEANHCLPKLSASEANNAWKIVEGV